MRKWLNWLKRHFVPHIDNAYRPHFLLGQNVRHLLGVVLGFELMLFILPGLNFATFLESLNLSAVLPSVLSTLTNAERLSENLPELRENPTLNKAAQLKAEDMAKKGYFAHVSPEGKSPWYWFDQVGYTYYYAGENLAVNFIDSQAVTRAWMNSPSHRANIVQRAYTEIGTGAATGTYKGNESIFVAQVYALPRISNPLLGAAAGQKITGWGRIMDEAREVFEQTAASPRQTTDAVLYTVLTIVSLSLILNIFIKIRVQHPDLILNGAIVMIVALGLHIMNDYITANRGLETSFMAFTPQGESQPLE